MNRASAAVAVALPLLLPVVAAAASQLANVERLAIRRRLSPHVELRAATFWGRPGFPAVRKPDRPRRLPVLAVLRSAASVSELEGAGITPGAVVGRVASLRVDPEELDRLSALPGVVAVRVPQRLRMKLDVNGQENGAVAARQAGAGGVGVLVAVIDSGIDYTHADFRDSGGRTRIKSLWDQRDRTYVSSGGSVGSAPPIDGEDGQPLGTVYTEEQINAALDGAGTVSSLDLVGHGTLAAGAAAGNGRATGNGEAAGVYVGSAPEASLLAVRIGGDEANDFELPGDVIAALAWIEARAGELGMPVVVNMSFGGHIGPHDGSTPEELAIDDFVAKPGRAVAVAAGNEGDIDLHASGSIVGALHTVELFQGGESNEILVDCWIPGADRVDLGFTDPTDRGTADLNVDEDNCGTTTRTPNRVTACLGGIDPVNGDREVLFLVEPTSSLAPISAGRWQFHLRDEGEVQDGRFDCWSANEQEFLTDVDGGGRISQPGTAHGAITVGALSARNRWPSQEGEQSTGAEVGALAVFSSPGPTRDGRLKPEIVTGGEVVVGTWSIGDGSGSGVAGVPPRLDRVASDGVHVSSRGTSFSTPQVAGAIALFFERNPRLTTAELRDLLAGSARSDGFTGSVPNDLWGFGKLDVAAALARVAAPPPTPTPTATPSSTPSSSATSTPTPAVTATGTPALTRTPTSTPLISFPGDSDCDGRLTTADVDATAAALFDSAVRCSADCNRDGRTDVADVTCVFSALGGAAARSS